MKFRVLMLLLAFCLVLSQLSAQETSALQQPSQELLNTNRLVVPNPADTLDPSAFPRLISPQDIALTTGNFLFHFTAARFQLAETGPENVDLILEGYISNYSNTKQEFFDGDFRLIVNGQQILPAVDMMRQLKASYGDTRDYPGRNILFVPRLSVESHTAHFIYLAYRIPADTRDVSLSLGYANGHFSTMRLLLVPADTDGTSEVEVYKLAVDNMAQYLFLDPIEGEASESGAASNIVDPFRYDNCSREPASISYDSYSSSEHQRLENFELNISPETDTHRFLTIFGLVVFSETVEQRLFELNYQRFESSREMLSQSIQSSTSIRAFTAFHYRVLEQPMRRVDTFRVLYGTEVLEFPYTIEYSIVKIETFQEDISTEYCDSRSQ